MSERKKKIQPLEVLCQHKAVLWNIVICLQKIWSIAKFLQKKKGKIVTVFKKERKNNGTNCKLYCHDIVFGLRWGLIN